MLTRGKIFWYELLQDRVFGGNLNVRSLIMDRIMEYQNSDRHLLRMRQRVQSGKVNNYRIRDDGMLCIGDRVCVPRVGSL